MKEKEFLKITDKHGFVYEVKVIHSPHLGFSCAYYEERIIADRSLNKMHEPLSDDDREWEMYEESLSEWKDAVNSDLIISCQNHFNTTTK